MRNWRELNSDERLAVLKAYNDDLLSLHDVAVRFGLGSDHGVADTSNLHKCLGREARRLGLGLRTKGQGTSERDSLKQQQLARGRFAPDDPIRAAALEMVAQGSGRAEVARALGVHPATISRWVKGITNAQATQSDRERLKPKIRTGRPPTRYTAVDVAAFFRLHHVDGLTMPEIAARTGASVDTVFMALHGRERFSEVSRPFVLQFGAPIVGRNLDQAGLMEIFEAYWLRNEPTEVIARRFDANPTSILNLLNSKIERYAHWTAPLLRNYGPPCRHSRFDSRHESFILTTLKVDYPEIKIVGDRDRRMQPPWLGRQRFDVWIPEMLFAIEYNGIQHYEPVAAFGGSEKLALRERDDALKLSKCLVHQVALLVIRYDEPLDREYLYLAIQNCMARHGRSPVFSDWETRRVKP
jgi:transposase-like protein